MVNRLGQLAGGLLLLLVVARLGRLIQIGTDLPRWVPILIAAAMLGAVVQWLLYSTRMPALLGGLIMAIGGAIIFLRVSVPQTLVYGVVPTADTLPTLASELDAASRLIRFGVPPVVPEPALIGILALLLWSLGAIYILGVLYNRLSLMVLPAGIVYLQFAVFDRVRAGLGWMIASATVLVLAFAALSFQRRNQVGAVRDDSGRAQAIRSSVAPLLMAGTVAFFSILGANQASAMVSEYGNVPWRSWGGSGAGGGSGIAFNRFLDLRQRLINRSNAVVFRATLGPDGPPADSLYWRLESLDRFDGEMWTRSSSQSVPYRPGLEVGLAAHRYQGSSTEILQRVYLDHLAGDVLPSAGAAAVIHQLEDGDSLNTRNIRISNNDGSLLLPEGLRSDSNYQLIGRYPRHDLDLGAMATGSNGELSPLFAAAAEAGTFGHSPEQFDRAPNDPADLARYTDLPDDTPNALHALAISVTRSGTTDFEKAWLLEHWLREGGDFTYSTSVTTGHSSLNLVDWLLTPGSTNYRTGYCEQFAATMAVLARLIGIPSRVVIGFTPGTVNTVDNVEVIEVRDTNAHAWVEIWISGFGWVKFDPTPGGAVNSSTFLPDTDPALLVSTAPAPGAPIDPDLPDDTLDPDEPTPITPPTNPIESSREFPRWPLYILGGGLLVGFVPFMKRLRRQARLDRLMEGDITAAWEEIVDRLSDMGDPLQENLTPLEFAASTSKTLVPLARDYSAAVYGGRNGAGRTDDLAAAEMWIEMTYDRRERLKGTFNPRSLLKRR